jgi:hypothetical protein
MSAVKAQEKGQYGATTDDPNQTMMVLPPGLAPNLADEAAARAKRENMQVLAPKVEILDPTLKAAMDQYPTHAVNGMVYSKTVNGVQQPDPSLLVLIPQSQAQPNATPTAPQDQATVSPDAAAYDPSYRPQLPRQAQQQKQQQQQRPGAGRLKSIGD